MLLIFQRYGDMVICWSYFRASARGRHLCCKQKNWPIKKSNNNYKKNDILEPLHAADISTVAPRLENVVATFDRRHRNHHRHHQCHCHHHCHKHQHHFIKRTKDLIWILINLHLSYLAFTGTITYNPPSDISSTTTKSMQIFCGRSQDFGPSYFSLILFLIFNFPSSCILPFPISSHSKLCENVLSHRFISLS